MRPAARFAPVILVSGALLASGGCGEDPVSAVVVTLRIAPGSVDFGSVPVGAAAHRAVAIANDGNGPYAPDAAPELSGDGFLEAAPCALPLAPRAFCSEDVVFRPQVEGDLQGSLVVHGPDGDVTVPLTGHAAPAQVVVSPAALDFGSIDALRSANLPVRVENTGDAALDAPLVVSGEGFAAGGATRVDVRVEPGAAVSVPVTFAPAHGGSFSGRAVLEICGPDCGPEVALSGLGTAPRLDIEPRTADFGAVAVGDTGTVVLAARNSGVGDLVITSVDLLTAHGDQLSAEDVTLPVVIHERGVATLTLRYAPAHALGALESTLRVRSNDPVSSDVLVPIEGSSDGPAIELLPQVANFGVLDPGDSRTLDVVVRSVGTVAADVGAVTVVGQAFAFDLAAPPTGPLLPGESLLFTVRATAAPADADAGGAAGRVVASAAGLDDVTLPMSFLSGTTGCQPRAPAPNAALGSIKIGQGATGSVVVQNIGDAPCVLDDAGRAPGFAFDPGFSFSAVNARTIDPGRSAPISFAYHAAEEGQRSAFASVTYAGTPGPLLVSATARGVTGTLVGEPALLSIGPVVEGCTAADRTATFVNAGSDTVVVNDIVLDDPAAPFALGVGHLPASVVAGGSVSVGVSSFAAAPGVYDAAVQAVTDIVEAAVRVELTVVPQGEDITEHFTAADVQAVDVLFVVDNSGSMADDQDRLAQNFDTFIDSAFAGSVDFHIAVTTTDVINGTGGPEVGPFLTRNSHNVSATFADQARVGVDGAGIELGLEAMRRALSDFADTDNAGFLRGNAALSVVIVSDEDDNGGDESLAGFDASLVRPVDSYIELLGGLKGGNLDNTPVLVSVVVTPAFSPRYEAVASAFAGVVLNIQDDAWGTQLSQVGQATFGLQRRFRVGADPDPSTVTVTVNGAPVSFTVDGRDVFLDDDPPAGADVAVTYRAGCGT